MGIYSGLLPVDMFGPKENSEQLIKQDITEIKTNNKPVDIIKLTFDGLQILQSKPVMSVKVGNLDTEKWTKPTSCSSFYPLCYA